MEEIDIKTCQKKKRTEGVPKNYRDSKKKNQRKNLHLVINMLKK